MHGDGVLGSKRGRPGNARFQDSRARESPTAQILRGGVVLGVVTVLHLSLMVYLTIPPAPIAGARALFTVDDADALKVRFVETLPSTAMPKAASHPHPAARATATTSIGVPTTRSAVVATKVPASAEPLAVAPEERHVDTGVVAPRYEGPATPYGNPLLRGTQTGNLTENVSRIPGGPDATHVGTIALKEPPSVAQVIGETGHYMNCSQVRIARFLSASEMDRRRITKQELDQAFTEFGCK